MKTSGEIIREKREQLGITAEKLGELTGVSQAYVTTVENNRCKPSKAFLQNIIEILHLNDIELKLIREYEEFRRLPINIQEKLKKYNNMKLDSRGKRQLNDLMEETTLMFDDENITIEDKEKMMLAIQEAFYIAKAKNKRK